MSSEQPRPRAAFAHTPTDDPGMSLRAYFAAHAPDVPELYPWRRVETVVIDSMGRKGISQANEPALARTVRWRLAYADAMLEATK